MLATVLCHPFVIFSLLTAIAEGFENRKGTNDYKMKDCLLSLNGWHIQYKYADRLLNS